MSVLFSFATGLSAIFLSVFLWKMDETYTLLATYSLTWSIAIIVSFALCASLARKTSPMIAMRLGLLCYVFEFLLILVLNDSLPEHVVLLGMVNGLAMSLYYVGVHLAVLEFVETNVRDKYFYIQNILFTIAGIISPLVSGFIISRNEGMTGYYVVFGVTCLFLFIALLVSLKITNIQISKKSYFRDVIKTPSKEWKEMYKVMVCDGIVGGVYFTFLITMMTYSITGGEEGLSIYQSSVKIFTIVALYLLVKRTNYDDRIKIYSIGAILLFLSSLLVSVEQSILALAIYGMVSTIAINMYSTPLNTMIYEAIERDKDYEKRKLDYIIIREIPLGIGRMIGVLLFLFIRNHFDMDVVLPISFALFPFVYVLMIPWINSIWGKKNQSNYT